MQTSDVNNQKDGRVELVKQNAELQKDGKVLRPLPKNQRLGKNDQGYDILPNEGK